MLLKQGPSTSFREMPKRLDFAEVSRLIERKLCDHRKTIDVLTFRSRSSSATATKLASFRSAAAAATQRPKKSKQPSLMRPKTKIKKQESFDSPSMAQTIAAEEMSNALQPSKIVINDFPSTKGRMLEK